MCQHELLIEQNKPESYVVFVELGSGWGAIVFESEVEFHFIEENLRADQNQEYFVNGSFYDEIFSIINFPLGFQVYTPRQSSNKTFTIFSMILFVNLIDLGKD